MQSTDKKPPPVKKAAAKKAVAKLIPIENDIVSGL